jgi:hypothetical protein
LPLKSDKETVLPFVSLAVNAGALEPTAKGIIYLPCFKISDI